MIQTLFQSHELENEDFSCTSNRITRFKLNRSIDIALRGDPSFSENKGLNAEVAKVKQIKP